MTMVFGVFDPGFRDGLEPCPMMADETAARLFQAHGVPGTWGQPDKCVGWFDPDDNFGGAVATYPNGKAAHLRVLRNGHWELTYGIAPK